MDIRIELVEAGNASIAMLNRHILNQLKEQKFDELLCKLIESGQELKWSEPTKDAYGRPQSNKQFVKFDTEANAATFIRTAAQFLPQQWAYAKVVKVQKYVDANDKLKREKLSKTYMRTFYLNEYRVQ